MKTNCPKWAIIGGLSHPGQNPTPPQRDWVVRLMSYLKAGDIQIPIYLKENAKGMTLLNYREFLPGFPVYEEEEEEMR